MAFRPGQYPRLRRCGGLDPEGSVLGDAPLMRISTCPWFVQGNPVYLQVRCQIPYRKIKDRTVRPPRSRISPSSWYMREIQAPRAVPVVGPAGIVHDPDRDPGRVGDCALPRPVVQPATLKGPTPRLSSNLGKDHDQTRSQDPRCPPQVRVSGPQRQGGDAPEPPGGAEGSRSLLQNLHRGFAVKISKNFAVDTKYRG